VSVGKSKSLWVNEGFLIFCFYFQQVKNITQTSSILLFWQTNNTIVFTQRDLDFPTDTSYFRSKLTYTYLLIFCLKYLYGKQK
jgi:hypothetical protein